MKFDNVITGLSPSTKYRVTVRAKHLRAVGQAPPPGPPPEEAPGAYTDFRTLAKGLPDPPQVSHHHNASHNYTDKLMHFQSIQFRKSKLRLALKTELFWSHGNLLTVHLRRDQ